jgi:hypothetical protein
MYKICNSCKELHSLSNFAKNKSKKDGHGSQCKYCVNQYKIVNKEKITDYKKKYRESSKEKISEYNARYREANIVDLLEYKKKYRECNKERLAEYNKRYHEINKEYLVDQMKHYREANKEYLAEQVRIYQKANPAKLNAINAKRRAAKLQATPRWLTDENFKQIEDFYKKARNLKLATGEKYHVDHIIPLQGKNVCGLHVPWNLQVIPAKENLSKSNKLQEELL